jgi:hypothetical protein
MESAKKVLQKTSVSAASVSSSELAFITFLVDFVVETNPGDLFTNLSKISQHMLDHLPPKCEANLYRKQYGNLKDCILQGKGILQVFNLDGTCFRFKKHAEVMTAYKNGAMTEDALSRYLYGRNEYLLKHLNLMKDNDMNECAKCD